MTVCKICKEKDKEIELLEKRVDAVIKGHQNDKRLWAKQEKRYFKFLLIMAIAAGIAIIISFFILGFGKEGLLMIKDTAEKIIIK